MGTRKIEGPLRESIEDELKQIPVPMTIETMGRYFADEDYEQRFLKLTAKDHVLAALDHIKIAAEKTRDPGLQGDLERARAKLQRRIDLTQGL